jgi:hypothetical protein
MTSVDTPLERVAREIPELTTVPGGIEIRYAGADFSTGAAASSFSRYTGDVQLRHQWQATRVAINVS